MDGSIGFAHHGPGPTRVRIELNRPHSDMTEQVAPSSAKEGAGPARILLVEDVPVNQALARAVLRQAGHSVEVANDGIEAHEAVSTGLFDVILMDIQMPRMDGMTATRKIRAMTGQAARTPIIAMTASALPEQLRRYRAAGMDGHIPKPFKLQELDDCIRRAVGRSIIATPSARLPAEKPRTRSARSRRGACLS